MTLSDCGVAVSPQTQVWRSPIANACLSFWIARLGLPPYTEVLHLFLRHLAVIMVGQKKGIRCLILKEEACPSKFSRWVRLPFTQIQITYHTNCCLISARIHGCWVKFNHTVRNHLLDYHRRYGTFRFVWACHVAALAVLLTTTFVPLWYVQGSPGPQTKFSSLRKSRGSVRGNIIINFTLDSHFLCPLESYVVYNWNSIIISALVVLKRASQSEKNDDVLFFFRASGGQCCFLRGY